MSRAHRMKAYLAGRGVPVDRMTIVLRTFGECVPVATNATAEGRAAQPARRAPRIRQRDTGTRQRGVCGSGEETDIPRELVGRG